MKQIEVQVSTLTGPALDWAVAQCERQDVWIGALRKELWHDKTWDGDRGIYCPSDNWEQGGPIIERERIELRFGDADAEEWIAEFSWHSSSSPAEGVGSTPLVAAMRCYVASKMGDTIFVPEELLA
jgi:hypothetical protein